MIFSWGCCPSPRLGGIMPPSPPAISSILSSPKTFIRIDEKAGQGYVLIAGQRTAHGLLQGCMPRR